MKITIYELIGLVKDGKQPKKIKYKGQEYTFFDDEIIDYSFKDDNDINGWLSTNIGYEYISDIFTNTVEIIEEPKKIEKISWGKKESLAGNFTASEKQEILARRTEKLKFSLNELIDEINKVKGSKE